MKKRGAIISLILGLFLTSFASAQFLGNFYGTAFNESLLVYGGIFIVLFAVISFSLGRVIFKENKVSRTIVGAILSLFATYGIARSNFHVGDLNVGSANFNLGPTIPTILTLLFIAGLIYFIVKWGLKYVLGAIGLLLIVVSLTDLVFEKSIFMIVGIVFLFIGLLLQFRKPRIRAWGRPGFMRHPRERLGRYRAKSQLRKEKRQARKALIEEKKRRWHEAGRRMGYSGAKAVHRMRRLGRR